MTEPSDLSTLRALLERWSAASPEAADSLGLFMSPDLKPSGYDQTPAGCLTFAWTGGDGVHFSLADLGHGITNASPVVMTVPMQFDAPNMVVGENLSEFLALGLLTGYFVLEQLAYDRAGFLPQLTVTSVSAEEAEILRDIAQTFGIAPWEDPGARLDVLNGKFASLLPEGSARPDDPQERL